MDNNEKTSEKITKWLLVGISVLFLAVMLLLPLITVITVTSGRRSITARNKMLIPIRIHFVIFSEVFPLLSIRHFLRLRFSRFSAGSHY